jgi:hypothetical protein
MQPLLPMAGPGASPKAEWLRQSAFGDALHARILERQITV